MLGSPVPMVPLPGVAASALESYSRFLVSGRARGIKIELEREREREREILPRKTARVARVLSDRELHFGRFGWILDGFA